VPKKKKIDHRGILKGIVGEVREELRKRGEDISLPSVSNRIKMRRNEVTMKIYRDKLRARMEHNVGSGLLSAEIDELLNGMQGEK
jgi:hypothetical protein